MRITFLTQDDPLYILPFFESFFSQEHSGIEIGSIFICRPMGGRKRTKLLGELLQLYGILGFARFLCLQVWMRFAAAIGVGRITAKAHSICEIARANGISCHRMGNPNQPDNVAVIAADAPDIVISVACPYILKRRLLDIPRCAALNIHHAPLPRYRGMMPTFWQLYHSEATAGITIHTMAEDIDRGNIMRQDSIEIIPGESMHSLIRRSKRAGGLAMLQVLRQYTEGTPPTPLEQNTESSYFSFPTRGEMHAFRQRGLRAI